ncbi:I78 family peptidase inhibitor [Terricaulis silvestris]|uniref:Peptidase inhibitor I78 family protein n=1 Tax=Terricaulis silvestris TaxID=2686094 RepID=A0A6I6MW83_9CAUL|nr:I78 family peptidase inhibitor [Terricaulis silvestris]QGZ95453.1 Peptidase inhibitor I78 family protein [Terricaulis silvestris]
MIRASLFAFALLAAACTPPAADTPPPAEPAAFEAPVGPTNAAEATAADTCGAAAHQALIGTPASGIDLATLPPGTRIVTPETMVTQDFVPTRLNITTGTDGNVASLNCY